MSLSAVLALAWLPLMLFFTDLQALAQPPDSLIQITLPQTSNKCFLTAKKTYNVRFQSLKAAGGTFYERKLIFQSVLGYLQSLGAINVTANVISTCVNAAEKKKMNVFRYNGGVCTLYTVLPAPVLLSKCGNVGTVVVYMVKTSLNKVTSPIPQVVNITLDPINYTIIATWNVVNYYSLIQGLSVKVNNVTVIISLTDTSLTTTSQMTVSIGTFQLISAGETVNGTVYNETTYRLVVTSPARCTKTFVSVTPLNADGWAAGETVTGPNLTTWPDPNEYGSHTFDSFTFHNLTLSWHFADCGQVAYGISYNSSRTMAKYTVLNKSTTSVTFLDHEVCSNYTVAKVSALDRNGNQLQSTIHIDMSVLTGTDDSVAVITPYNGRNACILINSTSSNYYTTKKTCTDVYLGNLFQYGTAKFHEEANELGNIGWIDLQYSPSSGIWLWGNGEEAPTNSSIWETFPNSTIFGVCVASYGTTLSAYNCSSEIPGYCYKFY